MPDTAVAAPWRGKAGAGSLAWPRPAPARLLPCSGEEEHEPGRGFFIAGGILVGVGFIPTIIGVSIRSDYKEDSTKLINPDGSIMLGVGGSMLGAGVLFLIIGGALRAAYNRDTRQTRLGPTMARSAHGTAITGLQLRF